MAAIVEHSQIIQPHEIKEVEAADPRAYRDYSEENERFSKVSELYFNNHTKQTFDFNIKMRELFDPLDKLKLSIWEAFDLLEEIIDESDPDLNGNQITHALQTAEAIRAKYPEDKWDWFWLVGLIHDLGKILSSSKMGKYKQGQWCVVGDTFPLGCLPQSEMVWFKHFATNPDLQNPLYSTTLGVYKEHCGLDNLMMSFGHDEYMYRVCIGNQSTLPHAALYVIRYHSFYAWHHAGGYKQFMNEQDKELLPLVQSFQKCDLYSKSDDPNKKPDFKVLKPFYTKIINKYFHNKTLR